jgi:hypothetical protein
MDLLSDECPHLPEYRVRKSNPGPTVLGAVYKRKDSSQSLQYQTMSAVSLQGTNSDGKSDYQLGKFSEGKRIPLVFCLYRT